MPPLFFSFFAAGDEDGSAMDARYLFPGHGFTVTVQLMSGESRYIQER